MNIIFYTKEMCSLCDDAEALLSSLAIDYPHTIEKRDIYSREEWLLKYQLEIPVLEINGEQINCNEISFDTVEAFLKKHSERN